MVQFEINIKLSTINGKGLNRLIARKETKKLSYCRETALQGGGLDATYAVNFRFTRPVMVFLLLIIELFRWLKWLMTALGANIDSKSVFLGGWSIWPELSGRK